MNLLRKIWNDPVGSNVIATFISSGLTMFGMSFFDMPQSNYWFGVIIVTIVLLFCFVLFKKYYHDDKAKEADEKLFLQILDEILPMDYMNDFYRCFDFGNPFLIERLKPINELIDKGKDPRFEFHDSRLEKKKKRLVEDMKLFETHLSPNIFTVASNDEFVQISPERAAEDYNIVLDVNRMATQVTNDYDDFYRVGKKIFKI
jgi:hypothetical protein